MAIELQEAGLICQKEVAVPIYYKTYQVGAGRMDIVIYPEANHLFVLELKAVRSAIGNTEQTQLLHYLQNLKIAYPYLTVQGLVLNFPKQGAEVQIIDFSQTTGPGSEPLKDASPV